MTSLAVVLSSCTAYRVAERVPSPDHKLEAVLAYESAGAPSELGFDVYITLAGTYKYRAHNPPVLEGTGMKDLKLVWKNERVLDVVYSKGVIGKFTNYWVDVRHGSFHYVVEVRLKPTSEFSLNKSDL